MASYNFCKVLPFQRDLILLHKRANDRFIVSIAVYSVFLLQSQNLEPIEKVEKQDKNENLIKPVKGRRSLMSIRMEKRNSTELKSKWLVKKQVFN